VKSAAPRYAVLFIALAMLAIGGLMSWVTLRYFISLFSHGRTAAPQSASAVQPATTGEIAGARLQQDVLSDFAQAAQQAKSGDITDAEAQVDQAASEMENARVASQAALEPASRPSAEFFSRALAALDAIVKAGPNVAPVNPASVPSDPSNPSDRQPADLSDQDLIAERIFQHVTQARIELAEMRSFEQPMPSGSTLAADAQARAASVAAEADAEHAAVAQAGDVSAAPGTSSVRAVAAQMPKLPLGHVAINSPRQLAANDLLDPAALGANFLDASMMPDTVEILLPPETRRLSDNVRVENLTIAGASQTLDGIHWRDVTFIRTRLRYEDGQLDLQNVRFVNCTFGFPSDERGASVANAIALGKTSIAIP